MSKASVATSIVVGALIVLAVVYSYYETSSQESVLSNQVVLIESENAAIEQGASQAQGALQQQINGLAQQVSTLDQRTVQVVTQTNTVNNIITTTLVTTTTVTSISQVPQATLIVVSDNYSASDKTLYLQVQNTQNFTVYAQASATISGDCGCAYSNMGFFISQIYQFSPLIISKLSYNLTLTSYNGGNLNQKPTTITLNLQTAGGMAVSPTYTFQYPEPNLVT